MLKRFPACAHALLPTLAAHMAGLAPPALEPILAGSTEGGTSVTAALAALRTAALDPAHGVAPAAEGSAGAAGGGAAAAGAAPAAAAGAADAGAAPAAAAPPPPAGPLAGLTQAEKDGRVSGAVGSILYSLPFWRAVFRSPTAFSTFVYGLLASRAHNSSAAQSTLSSLVITFTSRFALPPAFVAAQRAGGSTASADAASGTPADQDPQCLALGLGLLSLAHPDVLRWVVGACPAGFTVLQKQLPVQDAASLGLSMGV